MLKEKRPDIEIVGDEVPSAAEDHRFLALYRQDQGVRRRQRHHRQLGPGLRAADEGRRRRRPAGRTGTPTTPAAPAARRRSSRPALSHRVFAITEGFANAAPEAAQKCEAAFRAKEGVGLFYPRAVNEMRMLAKAANEAKSDDAKAVADQLEGMKIEAFDGGEGFMRKDDHQFFQPMYIGSFGPLDPGAKFDEEGTGWGWKLVGAVKAEDTVAADHLQDGAALKATERRTPDLSADSLRAATYGAAGTPSHRKRTGVSDACRSSHSRR